MFEFKGLIASSAQKYNENTGFSTPHHAKSIFSRKNVFSEKTKTALGDVKNTAFNTTTPLKKTIEKQKIDDLFKFSTPKLNIKSTLQPTTAMNYSETNLMDAWNDKLLLSDDQMNLLFCEPNDGLEPPKPPTPDQAHSYFDFPFPSDLGTSDFGSRCELGDHIEHELPSLNVSYLDDDIWSNSNKENSGDIVNKISNYF